MSEETAKNGGISRRTLLRLGAAGGAGAALVAAQGWGAPFLAQRGLLSADGAFAASSTALGDLLFYTEAFPTSPLILDPFNDRLPIPKSLAPVPKSEFSAWAQPPGPGPGQQNSLQNERHQIWSPVPGGPDPVVYKIDLLLRAHVFTTSKVLPINAKGRPTVSFDAAGKTYAAGTTRSLCGLCPGVGYAADRRRPVRSRRPAARIPASVRAPSLAPGCGGDSHQPLGTGRNQSGMVRRPRQPGERVGGNLPSLRRQAASPRPTTAPGLVVVVGRYDGRRPGGRLRGTPCGDQLGANRHHRDEHDRDEDQVDIPADPFELPQPRAQGGHAAAPKQRPDRVEAGKNPVVHTCHTGDHRGKRTDYRHETGQDDRPAAEPPEEPMGLGHVVLAEQP
jgi:hypothetical protein